MLADKTITLNLVTVALVVVIVCGLVYLFGRFRRR